MTELLLHCPAFTQNRMSERNAFGKIDDADQVVWGGNLNPALSWERVPSTTQSLALVCCDLDAPSVPDQVNQQAQKIPATLARVPFYHWLLWNIPVSVCSIPEGALSRGVTERGKPVGMTAYGCQGTNDYSDWFASDDAMAGLYGGYDGPCPPWNDQRIHRYVMTLYALDTPLDLPAETRAKQLLIAMSDHILGKSSVMWCYSLNTKHTQS